MKRFWDMDIERPSGDLKQIAMLCCKQSYSLPKVSVIVPAYNTEDYIASSLHSLIAQTLKEIEIIVVDDGSTDSTASKVREIAGLDARIKFFSQSNQKQGAARNRGIEIATGEYIGFVDSDDWVEADYYAKLYEAAKKNNFDMAVAGIVKHKRFFKCYNMRRIGYETASDLRQKIKLCEDKKHRFFNIYNKIYKSSLIKDNNIRFSNEVVCEDVMFSMKSLYYSDKIIAIPNIYYHYNFNVNSSINSKDIDKRKKKDHIKAYCDLAKFANEHNIELYDRLNYGESYWKLVIKVYKGLYKTKYTLLGLIPLFIKHNDESPA
ncbi:MAG: glycosyltransferase family 2 protein [Lentisphaeria bacterium]|nr:glycosyltransferase family 2 protein [Lentisphaeria bacterium]